MKCISKIAAVAALAVASTACSDLFEPAFEPSQDLNTVIKFPNYADAILYNAYILLPYSSGVNSDVATDDAVSNDFSNDYLKVATGSWTANNGTLSYWKNGRGGIQYANLMLSVVDQVDFSDDPAMQQMFCDRLKGEAYGLRALFMYYLLRQHGGWVGGELLGVPNILEPEDATSDFNQPRASFKACVDQIMADVQAAADLLPLDYKNVAGESEIPAKYASIGVSTDMYNRANGSDFSGRMSGRIARVIGAQTALLAASPAFSDGSGVEWSEAADRAAAILDLQGGIAGIAPNGHLWYTAAEVGKLGTGGTGSELIWRSNIETNNTIEGTNFPPSLYGTGRVNPTQNLVDAFPMANGYPIADSRSGYDANNPYAGRDPRLSDFIVYNGSKWGHDNREIITGTYGTNNDALNAEQGHSTRTGYYLRKLLNGANNLANTVNTTSDHVTARMRYTQLFLDYAEAANEAWGPTNPGSHGYSAYDVVKAIRSRAGLGNNGTDAYLESIKGDREAMRQLIRNERRIELCFENVRFWDLRRWKANLNEPARGMRITNTGGRLHYEVIEVENRSYQDYMTYGPIPYNETLKFSNLVQNDGWK
ncbi:MAG: RagB/SusD family nutrient uptake outer membrane protein [Muribaculaceae bacterium]|nr:RagB/SusD family nutrient uptake outer membrane protein [Muribaculaceae bacterium]